VQSCGDCHYANFGIYAALDGAPIFDITDFDETLPAPFEWDLKRLATSFSVDARCRELRQMDALQLSSLKRMVHELEILGVAVPSEILRGALTETPD